MAFYYWRFFPGLKTLPPCLKTPYAYLPISLTHQFHRRHPPNASSIKWSYFHGAHSSRGARGSAEPRYHYQWLNVIEQNPRNQKMVPKGVAKRAIGERACPCKYITVTSPDSTLAGHMTSHTLPHFYGSHIESPWRPGFLITRPCRFVSFNSSCSVNRSMFADIPRWNCFRTNGNKPLIN